MINAFANRKYLVCYCLIAIVYTVSSISAPYALSPLIKATPIFILMAYVIKNVSGKIKLLLLMALGSSAIGDITLALEYESSFVLGLGAFLVAHIFYNLVFFPLSNKANRLSKTMFCILLFSYCGLMGAMVLPQELSLKIAVVLYMLVLSTMCCSAIFSVKKNAALQAVGAFIFALSDSIIAWDAFRQPLPLASVWIMSSYYLAQLCIVLGCVKLTMPDIAMEDALREN